MFWNVAKFWVLNFVIYNSSAFALSFVLKLKYESGWAALSGGGLFTMPPGKSTVTDKTNKRNTVPPYCILPARRVFWAQWIFGRAKRRIVFKRRRDLRFKYKFCLQLFWLDFICHYLMKLLRDENDRVGGIISFAIALSFSRWAFVLKNI